MVENVADKELWMVIRHAFSDRSACTEGDKTKQLPVTD